MNEYTWEVESTDTLGGTMVVKYKHGDSELRYNIPIPLKSGDLQEQIHSFAPVGEWLKNPADLHDVQVGHVGSGTFNVDQEMPSEQPNVAGSWNEEYLRAMIYQVMEEMRESEV